MRRKLLKAICVAALLGVAGVGVACGAEEEIDVVEGEPLELGELSYNVQLTRFLNRNDREDRAYLAGQPPAPTDSDYLAVFMEIENEGSEPQQLPSALRIEDTRDNVFTSTDSDSPFALDLGAEVEPGAELPAPDTAAASGPIQGAMVLFLIDRVAIANRPLELEIPFSEETVGRVELDI